MKKWGGLIALAVVLVGLLAAFLVLKGQKPAPAASPTPTVSANENIDLVDIESDKINKIVLVRGSETMTLNYVEREVEVEQQKEDGTTEKVKEKQKIWESDVPLDQSKASDLTYYGSSATAKRIIEEDAKDLSLYGLDNPSTITFYAVDGRQQTLELGDKTPTEDSYYIKKSDKNTVYTIDSYAGDVLCYGKVDIMSKSVYDKEGLTAENMSSLTFFKGTEKVFDATKVTDITDWKLSYPLEIGADENDLAKYLEKLSTLVATDIVEENPSDLKIYGLDAPKYTFSYTLDGKPYVLKLGSEKDSSVYGMFENGKYVYTFDSATLKTLDMPVSDVMDMIVYLPSIYDTEKAVFEIDGRNDVLTMNATSDAEDIDTYNFNGKAVEGENSQTMFKRYYQGAIAMMGDALDLKAQPQGTAFARFTYYKKNAPGEAPTVVELIPTPDGYGYYLMKNQQYTGLIMGKRQLDKEDMGIRQAYKNLMDALNTPQ